VGLSLLLLALLYLGQGKLIYIPRSYFSGMEALNKVDVVGYELGGKKQHLFFLKRTGEMPPARIWWIFGGNGSAALDWADLVGSIPSRDRISFVLFDYPGYGMNEGAPNPERIAASIDRAIPEAAAALGLSESELISRSATLGHSLGAAVAFDFAERYGLERVIAISPFTTMEAMARRTMGPWAAWILSHRYDNETALDSILKAEHPVAITIFHGEEDALIPILMGRSLAARDETGSRIDFVPVPEAGHNDIVMRIAPAIVALMNERTGRSGNRVREKNR